jgi:dephospho-CoA kinase
MVIGLTGPKLAGKGTAAAWLVQQHGAVSYTMSGLLSQIAAVLQLENSRENLIKIATGLRSQYGEAVLAESLQRVIAAAQPPLAIIDGIRMSLEVDVFSQLPDFRLIYIDAPARVRYERALQRGEKVGESEMTFDEFMTEERAVTEQQIVGLKDRAHLVVDNVQTLDELHAQIGTFISS